MNKKIVTAFLAALLAVGAAGCGEVKDQGGDKTADTPANTQAADTTTAAVTDAPADTTTTAAESKELSAEDAAKTVEDNIGKAQKAAKGELEGSYKTVVTYTPPASGEIAEKGVKPVSMTVEAKQKDKLTGVSYVLGYDSKGLLTINAVYDNEKEVAYATIPELSDGVLTGSSEDIKKMISDSVTPAATTVSANGEQVSDPATSMPDMEALKNIDVEALADDIATYVDTFKENFPEGKDAADYVVKADGVSITLKTKSFAITPEDSKKLGKAIADKGSADQTLKDAFSAMGVADEDYKTLWDSLTEDDANTETTYFDVYYNAEGAPVGFATKADENKVENYVVCATDDKNIIIDCNLGSQVREQTVKGHFTYENETLDGKLEAKSKSQDYESVTTLEYNNITVSGDKTVGDASFTQTTNGSETFKFTYSFDTNENGGTVEMKFSIDGQDMGSIKTEVQKTDASDVAIPSGTTYKFTDEESLQKYSESCNIEGWQENVKKTVGDELYTEIFGSEEVQTEAGSVELDTAKDVKKTA